ncbi:MAG TPA: porin [Candidatus Acidoferrales bacterium]
MSKPTRTLSISLLAILVFMPQSARASDVDRLLDLLVKKHVVTEREAADLRNQIKADNETQVAPSIESAKPSPTPTQERSAASAVNLTPAQAPLAKTESLIKGPIPLKLSGFVQARWTDAAGTTNPFEIRRARFELRGDLTPRSDFRVQVDVVDSPILLDARYDWNPSPYARVTVGQFRIPFSQESFNSPRDLFTISRSNVVNGFAPGRDNGSDGRDIGAMLEGGLIQRDAGPLISYSFGVFNGAGINRLDDNRRKDAAMRVAVNPFRGLTIAGDYYDGASGASQISKDRADLELSFVRGRTTIWGEYLWGHDGTIRRQGWYALAAYRFVPKLEGVLRYDTFNANLGVPNSRVGTYLGGMNWYVSPWVKLQANYGLVDNQARTNLTNTVQTQLQFQF